MPVRSWFSESVEIKESAIEGHGLFAKSDIRKDETIAIKGGHIIDKETFDSLNDFCKHGALQISPEMYVAPLIDEELKNVMNYVNHSCDPNVGLKGQLATVAIRDIKAGEELTGDYCIAYSNSFFQFDCNCGKDMCRKQVTSQDWQNPTLQEKYNGYFAQYLQDQIK